MKSFAHAVGNIFQPIFHLFGWILAYCYGLVPNYAIAIVMLTVVIMGHYPLHHQEHEIHDGDAELQPEIKKLQQKYKGPENRQLLNEEMMKLYREEESESIGGCYRFAPGTLSFHSLQCYQGLANKVTLHGKLVPLPRYIPASSKMYRRALFILVVKLRLLDGPEP